MLYDVFICHASEDKDAFVRPLAEELEKHHLVVWYDEFSLSVGDSLRRSIDQGLAKSRFGIVVISPAFFAKGWAQRELDGLVAREIAEERRLILPIWHNVSFSEVTQYSPPLADTYALDSAHGMQRVTASLLKKLRPDESPLIVARDELLAWNVEPPVISDEWWLNVVEASNRMARHGGYIAPEQIWGIWSFPLPNEGSSGEARGVRLAWTALQMAWSDYAEANSVCQITHPDDVHAFIDSFPGLEEVCLEYPLFTASYAPQLTIPEFSGRFAEHFDKELAESEKKQAVKIVQESREGSATTTDGKPPRCDEEWSLRHPTFGNYQPAHVASFYVQGEMFGASSKSFEHFDYLIWLLSGHSRWLPSAHREYLIQGMADWAVWPSIHRQGRTQENVFLERLYTAKTAKTFYNTKGIQAGLAELIADSLEALGILDNSQAIADEFTNRNIVETYFAELERRRERNRRR